MWVSASAGDQRAQQRCDLPLCGPPTIATCPAAPARSQPQHVAPLLERLVHERDRHLQRAAQAGSATVEAAGRVGDQRAEQVVEVRRLGQRRQPDLVRRRALAGEPADDDLQQASRRRVRIGRPRPAAAARSAARARGRVVYVQHRVPRPAGRRSARRRPGSGPETYAALNRCSGSVPTLR